MPAKTGLLLKFPAPSTSPGISRGASAELPQTRLRCRPTPRRGFARASSMASAAAAPLTIRLAVVRMPSRCARRTAWLMECERPKSSALTISRRAGERSDEVLKYWDGEDAVLQHSITPSLHFPAPSGSIIGNQGAGGEPVPGAQDEEEFLRFTDARKRGSENVELLRFEFLQQPPIDRAHQLGGAHRTAVLVGERLAGFAIELSRPTSNGSRRLTEARGVFEVQNLLRADLAALQLFERQVNSPALGIRAHVAQNVRELERLAEKDGVVATARLGVSENFDAQPADHRGHPVAVELQGGVGLVAFDSEVALHAGN